MQKVVFAFLFSLCLVGTAQAQFDLDKLFGGAALGYARTTGDFQAFAKGGFTYSAVVGYSLTDRLGVGIEYGGTIAVAVDTTLASGLFGLEAYGIETYLARSWYQLSDRKFVPYLGLGLGLARVAEPDVTINGETIEGATRTGLGAELELGFTVNGFNLSYAYVLGGRAPEDPVLNTRVADVVVSYHRFLIGYLYNF